jgi:hypothetical protein
LEKLPQHDEFDFPPTCLRPDSSADKVLLSMVAVAFSFFRGLGRLNIRYKARNSTPLLLARSCPGRTAPQFSQERIGNNDNTII